MKRTLILLILMLVAVAALSGASPAQAVGEIPQYTVTFVGDGYPTALNENGAAVGWVNNGGFMRGWVYTPQDGYQLLPLPAGTQHSTAADINDNGDVVGSAGDSFYGTGEAVLWQRTAGGYEAQFLGALPGFTDSRATAINNVGDIVGYTIAPAFPGGPGVLFNAPGGVQSLGDYGFTVKPVDINDARQVIGEQLRLDLDTGLLEDLGVPTGGSLGFMWTTAAAINSLGQVASTGTIGTSLPENRAILRYSDGTGWEELSGPGRYTFAYGINDNGDVTGHYSTYCFGGTSQIATTVYLEGLGMFCANDLVAPAERDWIVGNNTANDINNAGQITAVAGNSATGQFGAVILTPAGPLPPPTAPVNAAAEPHYPTWQQPWNAITLTWTDTSNIEAAFRIERRVQGTADWTEIDVVGRNVQSYWDMDVALATTYEYRVRAYGLGGNSGYSNIATATSPAEPVDQEAPVVTIIEPADGAEVDGNVQIVVEASDNIALNFMDVRYAPAMGDSVICNAYPGGAPNYTLTCSWNTRDMTPGNYTLTAYASDTMGNYGSQSITVLVGGTANPTLRVDSIDMSAWVKRGIVYVTGSVKILDQDGAPVRSVMVYGTWTLPDGSTMSRVIYTDRKGVAKFSTAGDSGTYVLTITNVIKTGYTFDIDNSVLTASITR